MKKPIFILFGLAIICLPTGVVFATSNPDTGPGCGLGKRLWDDWRGQKQIVPQMMMASTNFTGSYWFAIASGTSGCSNDGILWDSERASLYIELNYASLAEDMARGGGEHLASLATLMHVPAEHQPEFFAIAQERYALMKTEADTPATIHSALREAVAAHPVLAKLQVDR